MRDITIEDIPNELIIDILKRLDSDSLKNAVITCKLWKELIETSCTWLLVLNQEIPNDLWIDQYQRTKRKFHTIEINGLLLVRNGILIEIFIRPQPKVVKLVLNGGLMDSTDVFVALLKCLPNLEHIILSGVTLTVSNVSNVPRPELIKLKTLEISQSTYSFILCFTMSQLTTLKIYDLSNACPVETKAALTQLLRSQQQLTTLALRNIDYETCELFSTEILTGGNMQFQLTKVSLLDIELRESQNGYRSLLTFLNHHANTMKELELGQKFPNSIYELVFAQFKNLKSLQLMINELPNEMAFYEALEQNQSINNLIIMDSPPTNVCQPWLKEFIRRLPNITSLTLLQHCGRETVAFMAKNLTKLQKLTAKYFNGFIFGRVHFPKLTTLNIYKLSDEIDWDRFTRKNSQITELSIEIVADREALQCYDVERIMKNLKLHTLKIGRNFFPTSDCFDYIRQNCSEIKKLYFHEVCNYVATIKQGEGEQEDNQQPQERFGDVPGLRFCDSDCMATSIKSVDFWDYDEIDFDSDFDDDEKDDDNDDESVFDYDAESMMSDNDGESMISDNDEESMFSDNDGESMTSDNDVESMMSDNDGESMMSDSDRESIMSDSDRESIMSDNDVESMISDNDGDSMISDNDGDSMISDNDGDSMISDNDGDSMISDNDGDSMISDNDGDSMISDNDGDSIISDNDGDSMISDNDGDSMISDNDGDSMISDNDGDSMISDNDGDSMISDNDGDSMISDNDGDSMISDNDGDSMISDNDGESMMSDYDDNHDDYFDEDTMDS